MYSLKRRFAAALFVVLAWGSSTAFACDCEDFANDLEGGIIGIGRVVDSFAVRDVRQNLAMVFVVEQAEFDKVSCLLDFNHGTLRVDIPDAGLSITVRGKTASGKLWGYELDTKKRVYLIGER